MVWPSSFHCMMSAAFCMRAIVSVSRRPVPLGWKDSAGSSL